MNSLPENGSGDHCRASIAARELRRDRTVRPRAFLAGFLALFLIPTLGTSGQSVGPDHGKTAAQLRCINPASGASWSIPLDFRDKTAGGFPARFTAEAIDWRDPSRNVRYRFDRATGKLTVVYPSSTGGFFLRDDCRIGR